jgi:hypothetical protein
LRLAGVKATCTTLLKEFDVGVYFGNEWTWYGLFRSGSDPCIPKHRPKEAQAAVDVLFALTQLIESDGWDALSVGYALAVKRLFCLFIRVLAQWDSSTESSGKEE